MNEALAREHVVLGRRMPGPEVGASSVPTVPAMCSDLTGTVRDLVAAGVFGEGEFLQLDDDISKEMGPQFASEIKRMVLALKRPSGATVEFPLVIKFQCGTSVITELRDTGRQFANEVAMYRDIIPFLQIPSSEGLFCPKIFYGKSSGGSHPEEDLLILEDLSPAGYIVSKDKLFLDFQHIALAMKKLGKLHSLSYRAKKSRPDEFAEKIKLIKAPDFKYNKALTKEYNTSLRRAIEPLLEKNVDNEILNQFLNICKKRKLVERILLKAEEPLATICHGDYLKNNMLYKYDSEGDPIECVLFDFQISMYSSPTVDISLFLYMHTTAEIRERHWDDFLKIYWTAFEENCRNLEIPSYGDFLEEFSKKAVYGFTISCFFIPVMLADPFLTIDEVSELTDEEQQRYYDTVGGAEAQNAISSIAKHILEKNYIAKFIEYYEKNIE